MLGSLINEKKDRSKEVNPRRCCGEYKIQGGELLCLGKGGRRQRPEAGKIRCYGRVKDQER